jgi:hypothetical protein
MRACAEEELQTAKRMYVLTKADARIGFEGVKPLLLSAGGPAGESRQLRVRRPSDCGGLSAPTAVPSGHLRDQTEPGRKDRVSNVYAWCLGIS